FSKQSCNATRLPSRLKKDNPSIESLFMQENVRVKRCCLCEIIGLEEQNALGKEKERPDPALLFLKQLKLGISSDCDRHLDARRHRHPRHRRSQSAFPADALR